MMRVIRLRTLPSQPDFHCSKAAMVEVVEVPFCIVQIW